MINTIPNQLTVREMTQGSEEAFRKIYQQLHQSLYYFALRFVSDADAKDVVSEAFVKVWEKRGDLKEGESLRQLLFVIVRNGCFMVLRREAMKREKHADILQSLEATSEEDLEIEQLRQDLIHHIYREVERLPEALQRVFLFSFKDGLKPAEIAEQLQVSVQTVRNQKVSAVKLLRTALGDRAVLIGLLVLLAAEN